MASFAGRMYMALCDEVGKDKADQYWEDAEVVEAGRNVIDEKRNATPKQVAAAMAKVIRNK